MKLAVDSSAFAKRYVEESGSDKLDYLLKGAAELFFCVILVPELISAFSRRQRERHLTPAEYRMVKAQLLEDVSDASALQITPAVVSHSVKLLEDNVLRSLDALHVACAIECEADLFATSDKRQFMAAKKAGLGVEFIGQM